MILPLTLTLPSGLDALMTTVVIARAVIRLTNRLVCVHLMPGVLLHGKSPWFCVSFWGPPRVDVEFSLKKILVGGRPVWRRF